MDRNEILDRYLFVKELGQAGGYNNRGITLFQDLLSEGAERICKKVDPKTGPREAEMLQKFVGIPEIVQLHEYVPAVKKKSDSDKLYMEYCNLGTLQQLNDCLKASNQKYPESFLWHVFLSLAKALEACHTGLGKSGWKPIMFQDMKGDNILLASSHDGAKAYPRVVLCDFGVAQEINPKKPFDLQRDVSSLARELLSMCFIDKKVGHTGGRSNITLLKSTKEAGTFAYSEQMHELLLELIDTGGSSAEAPLGFSKMSAPVLVGRIKELSAKAKLREHGGKLAFISKAVNRDL